MKYYYDLHIHSGLSPCASNDMTPNNIINMAKLKELDIISVTDHNSIANVFPIYELGKEQDILVIPGIEIETIEGVHVLCYFEKLEEMSRFYNQIKTRLPNEKNIPEVIGDQLIFNTDDEIIDTIDYLLIGSLNISLNELVDLVNQFKGIVILAHINKPANSIIANLGFINNELNINGIEIFKKELNLDNNLSAYTEKYITIYNSDAHYLGDISEKGESLELDSKTVKAFFNYLR